SAPQMCAECDGSVEIRGYGRRRIFRRMFERVFERLFKKEPRAGRCSASAETASGFEKFQNAAFGVHGRADQRPAESAAAIQRRGYAIDTYAAMGRIIPTYDFFIGCVRLCDVVEIIAGPPERVALIFQ